MTTYTLTQTQYDELHGTFANRDILRILKSLQPNLQEADAVVFQSAKNYGGEWSSIVITKTELQKETELYTHPAPMSKADMVKVLEALNNLLYFPNIKDNKKFCDVRNDAVKATTIMQSAIEGIK